MNISADWYSISNIDALDSPALVIYEERVHHNIEHAIKVAGHPSRLRPHIKTHKTREVVQLMMAAGITKFKCATIAEAELLGSCAAPDVLIAYQPTGPKIERLFSLIRSFPATRFSCLVDNAGSASAISIAARANDTVVAVFLDLNVGMNRTGILPADAPALYDDCLACDALEVAGVHAYDGHINDTNMDLRQKRADAVFAAASSVLEILKERGSKDPVLVIGGSPTFSLHAKRENVECSPGTFVYWDKAYLDLFPDMRFLPAALVISRVVSVLDDKTVCIDLGHKSIAAENALHRRVFFLNHPDANFVSQSEEHLVISFSPAHNFKVGDMLYGIPFHVCPTCALYDSATVIEEGQAKDHWSIIARNRKISI